MGDTGSAGFGRIEEHSMPLWELSVVEQRETFVKLALASGANRSELCREFGISRKAGYKWLERYRAAGGAGLGDRSRRPHASPSRTADATVAEVLRIRASSNNAWGGRKIAWTLASHGWRPVPALSTITEILRRHGKLDRQAQHPGPHVRFERAEPNELWQMDFKGISRWRWGAAIRSRCSMITRGIRCASRPATTSRT